MQVNQSQQIKLWPLCVHTKNQQYNEYSKTDTLKNRTWVKIPRVTKSIPWIALVAIALSPFPLFFTPKNPQNPLFLISPYLPNDPLVRTVPPSQSKESSFLLSPFFSHIYMSAFPKKHPKSAGEKSPHSFLL